MTIINTTSYYGNLYTQTGSISNNITCASSSSILRIDTHNKEPLFEVDINTKSVNLSEDCDLKLGNISIRQFLDRIEQRLEILHVNPELESEWTELKDLGNKYRQLEKELLEKNKVWEILKKTT